MQCPKCHETLNMTDRQGIEIDYCPRCRGVWLDRGELDKIIERSAALDMPTGAPISRSRYEGRYEGRYEEDHDHHHHKRKKKSLLGELFDF